jgi:hypothetical protein
VHPDRRHPEPRRPPRVVLVAKPGGGHRAITRLDPDDAATYRRLVADVASGVEASLSPRVVANRVAGPGLRLQDWREAHRRWRRTLSASGGAWLMTDVRDCYPSIRPPVVVSALSSIGAPSEEIGAFLGAFAPSSGLPVGPDASAVLANAVLAGGDRALAAAGLWHVRWVDDLAIRVDGPREALRALDAVWRALHPLGLEPNETKTRLLGGSDLEGHRRGGISLPRPPAAACDDADP